MNPLGLTMNAINIAVNISLNSIISLWNPMNIPWTSPFGWQTPHFFLVQSPFCCLIPPFLLVNSLFLLLNSPFSPFFPGEVPILGLVKSSFCCWTHYFSWWNLHETSVAGGLRLHPGAQRAGCRIHLRWQQARAVQLRQGKSLGEDGDVLGDTIDETMGLLW